MRVAGTVSLLPQHVHTSKLTTPPPPQLSLVDQGLAEDPQNAELLALRAELEQMLQLLNESLADLQQAAAAPAPAPPPPSQKPSSEEAPKWSRENHPAFKKAAAVEPVAEDQDAAAAPVVYQVNDNVLARWMSGDKGFYPARITSVTGSKTAPIYTVRFKSYDTVETVRGKDIKPVAAAATGAAAEPAGGQKRKAAPAGDGIVLSAGQELYPHAVEQKRQEAEGKKGADKYDELGRPKFKKIKAKKELEAGKNKWQEFTAKGKGGKTAKKESMFRTPEGPGGRGEFWGVLFLVPQGGCLGTDLLTCQQWALPARGRPCARTRRGAAMCTSPTKMWTEEG